VRASNSRGARALVPHAWRRHCLLVIPVVSSARWLSADVLGRAVSGRELNVLPIPPAVQVQQPIISQLPISALHRTSMLCHPPPGLVQRSRNFYSCSRSGGRGASRPKYFGGLAPPFPSLTSPHFPIIFPLTSLPLPVPLLLPLPLTSP